MLSQHSPNGSAAGLGTFQVVQEMEEEAVEVPLLLEQGLGSLLLSDGGELLFGEEAIVAVPGFVISEGSYLQTIDMIRDMGEGALMFGPQAAETSNDRLLRMTGAWD